MYTTVNFKLFFGIKSTKSVLHDTRMHMVVHTYGSRNKKFKLALNSFNNLRGQEVVKLYQSYSKLPLYIAKLTNMLKFVNRVDNKFHTAFSSQKDINNLIVERSMVIFTKFFYIFVISFKIS